MITHEVSAGNEQADIADAQQTLADELAKDATVLMVIRGEEDNVSTFAAKAAGREAPFPWRRIVWLKVSDGNLQNILSGQQFNSWFGGHGDKCAVVLDGARNASSHLDASASNRAIDSAFLTAQS